MESLPAPPSRIESPAPTSLAIPRKLAVGDGALGFWAALEEVYPATRQERCWVHKVANVLNYGGYADSDG